MTTAPHSSPLASPPESLRPDRREIMAVPRQKPSVTLAPGVSLDCLVGGHNNARGLTTGFVAFERQALLAYHTHPVSESITLLSGTIVMGVEGREYTLGPMDNIVIPRELAHASWNTGSAGAILHAALASESPRRDFVEAPAESRAMPATSTGVAGKERVTRFETARRFEAGPGTSFIDHFNETLIPDIEMSGGYGLFAPGGRLPAHFHHFDESICIIEGTATCIVEGRRHTMSDGATALQPRGRVHYFINESAAPMAMLWVYAGPRPDRIIVDERCATLDGDPWKDDSLSS